MHTIHIHPHLRLKARKHNHNCLYLQTYKPNRCFKESLANHLEVTTSIARRKPANNPVKGLVDENFH